MRLTRSADPAECIAFLDEIGYPSDSWDLNTLARYCLLTRIETPCGSVAGYIWFHWVRGTDRVLEFHIAVHPQYQGHLTRRVGLDILLLARSLGARSLLARPTSTEHADLLRRLSFSLHGPFAVLHIDPLDESLHPALRRAVLRGASRTSNGQKSH